MSAGGERLGPGIVEPGDGRRQAGPGARQRLDLVAERRKEQVVAGGQSEVQPQRREIFAGLRRSRLDVTEPPRALVHAGAGALAHAGAVIEHAVDGGDRDAGLAGDVGDGGAQSLAPFRAYGLRRGAGAKPSAEW